MRMKLSLASRVEKNEAMYLRKSICAARKKIKTTKKQHQFRDRRCDECEYWRDNAQLRGFDRNCRPGRRQKALLDLADGGQRPTQPIELLPQNGADLRRSSDPTRDRVGEKGHSDRGGYQRGDTDGTCSQPGGHAATCGDLDDRRKRNPDYDRCDNRHEKRATNVEANAQQHDEDPDSRYLRGWRPDVHQRVRALVVFCRDYWLCCRHGC